MMQMTETMGATPESGVYRAMRDYRRLDARVVSYRASRTRERSYVTDADGALLATWLWRGMKHRLCGPAVTATKPHLHGYRRREWWVCGVFLLSVEDWGHGRRLRRERERMRRRRFRLARQGWRVRVSRERGDWQERTR